MRSYTCKVTRDDGFNETIDISAVSTNDAAQKAVAHCNVHPAQETVWFVKAVKTKADGSLLELPMVQIRTRLRMHYEIE